MTTAKTVLIADDDWDLADALAMRVRDLGLKVRIAHDALATMHAIQNETPDLIALDERMPDGSGLNVCESMAMDPELARIPVIMITGLNDPATVERCRLTGAHYVSKASDIWQQIEPLILRLLNVGATAGSHSEGQQRRSKSGDESGSA